MAKVIFDDPIAAIKGKISSKTKTVYKVYSPTQTKYAYLVCHPRDYTTHPVTQAEQKTRTLFTDAVSRCTAILADPTQKEVYNTAFQAHIHGKQPKYATLRGYIIATEYASLKAASTYGTRTCDKHPSTGGTAAMAAVGDMASQAGDTILQVRKAMKEKIKGAGEENIKTHPCMQKVWERVLWLLGIISRVLWELPLRAGGCVWEKGLSVVGLALNRYLFRTVVDLRPKVIGQNGSVRPLCGLQCGHIPIPPIFHLKWG